MEPARIPAGVPRPLPAPNGGLPPPPVVGDETQAEGSVELNASVRQALARSVTYQILRRTFGLESPGAAPRDPEPAADGTEGSTPPAGQSAASGATEAVTAQIEARTVSRRELQVTAGEESEPVRRQDPLILDLDGDGIETTGLARGVNFDLDADGSSTRTSFAAGGDAFLALDTNGNGRIDNGRELFGDQDGAANGFEALRRHDANGDGRIDARDPVFDRLQLVSAGADGEIRAELLRARGVQAISLDYQNSRRYLNTYDEITQVATFEWSDGRLGTAADVLVGTR